MTSPAYKCLACGEMSPSDRKPCPCCGEASWSSVGGSKPSPKPAPSEELDDKPSKPRRKRRSKRTGGDD